MHHGRLGAALLLLEDEQRLVEVGVPLANCRLKDFDLRVLATEAQYSGSGYVRMMDVTCKQPAQVVGVLARPAATTFVHEKSNSVDILEESLVALRALLRWRLGPAFSRLSLTIESGQFRHLLAINLRRRESKFFLESLF
jgi:hypothetical protein